MNIPLQRPNAAVYGDNGHNTPHLIASFLASWTEIVVHFYRGHLRGAQDVLGGHELSEGHAIYESLCNLNNSIAFLSKAFGMSM